MVKKRKGRFLKVFLSIIIFIIFVLLISGYGYRNLRVYSIYYAQNIPHKSGTDPVMCAVIFNLSSVYLPHADLSTEIDRFKDNQHWVQSYNRYFTYNFSQFDIEYHRANQDFVSFSWYFFENTYNLVISDKNDNIYRAYEFNRSGRLLSIDIGDKSRTIPTNKDKEILSYWKNKLYGDIVQKRKKPIINLQWLYNRLNYKRFNS
ncbi:hypothetical protein [Lactococcus lactis]|uniref:hypothetical protein n=1 Tax=Lactococcus lactis TaxID=1358 RepID=UPI000C7A3691|nr:hypothetical protein [Lactococcus lactis]MCT0443623.1 hypothetical protein [Lactococcus lactis subsp. lactis]MDM7534698.1 hypothetical protein [Lactococcus lactis]USI63991.1 hypothetical protein LO769_05095 [Lactococcus lactis subsp. lactis]